MASGLVVWVDDWQQQCCGDPFSVGSRVRWRLHRDVGRDWVADVAGDDVAAQLTHVEDHHDLAPDAVATDAVVTRIRAVSCAYALDPSDRRGPVEVPVRGTAVLAELHEADPWFEAPDPLRFTGFVVDLSPVRG